MKHNNRNQSHKQFANQSLALDTDGSLPDRNLSATPELAADLRVGKGETMADETTQALHDLKTSFAQMVMDNAAVTAEKEPTMTVKIFTTHDGIEAVRLANGREYSYRHWLNQLQAAVDAAERGIAGEDSDATRWARMFLHSCGCNTSEKFNDLVKHLPAILQPADQTNRRVCRKCGSQIWGRESLVTGYGSECRRNGHTAKAARIPVKMAA